MLEHNLNEGVHVNGRPGPVRTRSGGELSWALAVARRILGQDQCRWAHTLGVVRLVRESLTVVALEERTLALAAAYTHDLGHARCLKVTGCHALDGAMYIRVAGYLELASVVAQHSGARREAALRGLEEEMFAFPVVESRTLDLLTYSDLMTDQRGNRCSVDDRLEEIAVRYGNDHIVTKAVRLAEPELRRTVSQVESRLRNESSRRRVYREGSDSHRSVA